MTVKLVDVYNTKYFYKTFCTDLQYLFTSMTRLQEKEDGFTPNVGNELLGQIYDAVRNEEEVIIDLADARLTSDALQHIYRAESRGIQFCDSLSSWRDKIFKENAIRKDFKIRNQEPLPVFGYKTDIKEYVKGLSTDVVYITEGQPQHILIALTCIATILRPSVQICVDKISRMLFKYINTKLPTEEILQHHKFYMCTDEGVMLVEDKDLYVQEAMRETTLKEALQYAILVPADFGEEVLLQNPSYRGLFNSSLRMLAEFQEGSSKTIEEIYA